MLNLILPLEPPEQVAQCPEVAVEGLDAALRGTLLRHTLLLLLVLPYVRKAMDHLRMDGARFTTRARGLGDVQLSGLYSVYRNDNHRVIGKGGLSLPSGSINARDNLPGMMGMPDAIQRLPYPMQLGSGTWDLLLGATYLGQVTKLSWGADIYTMPL